MHRLFLLPLCLLLAGSATAAETIQIFPSKYEVIIRPGEHISRTVTLVNQTSQPLHFRASVEDFTNDPVGGGVALVESADVTLSTFKNNLVLKPADSDFTLGSGHQRIIPVEIAAPLGATAGGRYVAVLFGAGAGASSTRSAASLTTRLGSLFFITIDGPMSQSGAVKEFGITYPQAQVLFSNEGDAHLDPYGFVTITNLWGQEVAFVALDPWFVLPHSARTRQFRFDHALPFGPYWATLKLNRGYGNVVDERQVFFWIWTTALWWWLDGGLLALALVGLVLKYKPWRR